MGYQIYKYRNLLNREFHADRPNRKWVTDISYIHARQGILYFSMIRDLYDNSIVTYKTETHQTSIWDWIAFVLQCGRRKREALWNCNSTVTMDFSTPRKHTSIRHKHTVLHRPCQGRGICMPTPWRKIFSPSSKPSAFTTINRLPFMKPMR